MNSVKNIAYGPLNRQKLDVFYPEKSAGDLVIYLHGGGLESGSKDEANFLYGLADKGITVVIPNYRLYPEAKYPQFIEDAAAAAAWTAKNRSKYCREGRTYMVGSSAGAYLAMMLCFDPNFLGAYGLSREDFGGFLFDAGQPTVHFNVVRESGLPTQTVIVDERAPMFHVRESAQYPPMLFLCAQHDIPGRYEQTLLMLSVLKQFGHGGKAAFRYMKGYDHCQYDRMPVFSDIILDFIKEHR